MAISSLLWVGLEGHRCHRNGIMKKNDAFSPGTIQKKMEIAEGEVVKLDGLLFSDGIPSRIAHWRSPIHIWDHPFSCQHTPSAWNFRAVGVISSAE